MTDGGDALNNDGIERSALSATGTGWERTPSHATQRAAWEALREGIRDWLGGAPFVIPDLETSDVQLKVPPVKV